MLLGVYIGCIALNAAVIAIANRRQFVDDFAVCFSVAMSGPIGTLFLGWVWAGMKIERRRRMRANLKSIAMREASRGRR